MTKKSNRTVVHLIHGTWANGWVKPKESWFQSSSPLAKRLVEISPSEIQLKPFFWSGRNSVNGRERAAEKFAAELRALDDDNVDQVIVAHSHGGTVAYEAVQKVEVDRDSIPSLKGMVCMGTPFVNVTSTTSHRYMSDLLLIAGFIDALIWTGVLKWQSTLLNTTWMLILVPALTLLTLLVLKVISPFPSPQRLKPAENLSRIPIFLLRATRDEAALSLGLMQTFNWISSSFALRNEFFFILFRRPLTLVIFAAVYMASVVLAVLAAMKVRRAFGGALDSEGAFNLVLIYSFGAAGFVFLLGYSLLAFSVGFFSSMEVARHESGGRWRSTRSLLQNQSLQLFGPIFRTPAWLICE